MPVLNDMYIDIAIRHGKDVADRCIEETKSRVLSLKDYYAWFVLCNLNFDSTNKMYDEWIETTKNSSLFRNPDDFYWSIRNLRCS